MRGSVLFGSALSPLPLMFGVVMLVQMVVKISGTRNGADWPAVGQVAEVSKVEGERLIAARLAKPVEKASKVEPIVETAVAPKAEKRGGLTKANGV